MQGTKAAEKKWLAARYPRLVITDRSDSVLLRGFFDFHCEYRGESIQDTYKVRFEIFLDGRRPILRVTDGRLTKVFAKHPELKEKADIHMYTNGTLCTITPQGWDLLFGRKPNLKLFFTDYIEPYFYSQSYFETNGVWPWKHYAHNTPGLMEWHLENWRINSAAKATATEILKLVSRDRSSQLLVSRANREKEFSFWNPCLCGKSEKYIDCHPFLAKLAHELRVQMPNPAGSE
jgi:hypothetical protein